MEIFDNMDAIMESIGLFAPLFACFIMFIDAIFPILPYALIIPFLIHYFGLVFGLIMAWVLVCFGCYVSFKFSRKHFKIIIDNKFMKRYEKTVKKWTKIINDVPFEHLVMLLAVPFTPAFLMNIVAGVSGMKNRKFIVAIMVGKVFLIAFWGYVALSLMDSVNNPTNVLFVIILVGFAFVVSKVVRKRFGIE